MGPPPGRALLAWLRAVLPRAQEDRRQPFLQCDTRGIRNRFMGRSFLGGLHKSYYYSRELSTCRRREPGAGSGPTHSKQLSEFLQGQSGVPDDTRHRKGMNRVCPRDRQNVLSVGHRRVLAFMGDPEAGLEKGPDGPLVADASQLGHDQPTSTYRAILPLERRSTVLR